MHVTNYHAKASTLTFIGDKTIYTMLDEYSLFNQEKGQVVIGYNDGQVWLEVIRLMVYRSLSREAPNKTLVYQCTNVDDDIEFEYTILSQPTELCVIQSCNHPIQEFV
jgi:hypothetical protein